MLCINNVLHCTQLKLPADEAYWLLHDSMSLGVEKVLWSVSRVVVCCHTYLLVIVNTVCLCFPGTCDLPAGDDICATQLSEAEVNKLRTDCYYSTQLRTRHPASITIPSHQANILLQLRSGSSRIKLSLGVYRRIS